MSDEIVRLIGDGDRASGGAIPLPDAFTAVVEQLLDHGSATFGVLNERVSDALAFKEARIMSSAWRTWDEFTGDILRRLSAIGVIEHTPYGRYQITRDFEPGKRYEAFPGSSTIGFTVHSKEERDQRDDNSRLLLELNKVISQMPRFAHADSDVTELLNKAQKILVRKLGMEQARETSEQQHAPRRSRAYQDYGKRVSPRQDITAWAVKFWDEADQDEWLTNWDLAARWMKDHPGEPPIINSDALGPFRRLSIRMVGEGTLERRSVTKGGHQQFEYRKAGEHAPLSDIIVPVEQEEGKVRWEEPW